MKPHPQHEIPALATTVSRGAVLVLAKLIVIGTMFVFGSGFAPFNSSGLITFTVESGTGDPNDPREATQADTVEAEAIFHTLSSRFGGGGVAVFVEFLPGTRGYSGLSVFDIRHAGLYDLYDPQVLTMPDPRRAELYYQEWDASGDRFMSDRVSGAITLDEIFRGDGISAMAFSFDLTFIDLGANGTLDSTDTWRRLHGQATTSPTVEQALRRESLGAYDDASAEDPYAPDGNIYVNCFGEVDVEEESYDEDSYAYEDDTSDSCGGDTWKDDSTVPEEEAGCDAKEPVDEGEPDPETGCDDSGSDISEPTSDDDLYYDDDDSSSEDDSSCEGDTTTASASVVLPAIADLCFAPSVAEASVSSPTAMRHMRATLARIARGERLDSTAISRAAHRPRTVFGKESWRTVRRILAYLPFFLLALGIHVVRRRMRRA